jgi:hypothetical protein
MEITSGHMDREAYLRAIIQVVGFLHRAGVEDILVSYGFGCDCPEEQLYRDVLMPLNQLEDFIIQSERVDYYRVGQDNLHIKLKDGRAEILFCHEEDIHLITEDVRLFEELKAEWRSSGLQGIYEKYGAEWQAVSLDDLRQI